MAEIEDGSGSKDQTPDNWAPAQMTGEAVAPLLQGNSGTTLTGEDPWRASTNQTNGHTEYRITYSTASAVGNYSYESNEKKNRTEISATLCFKFIKSKLNLLEVSKFKSRLKRLEKMVEEFTEIGQVAMAEQSLKMFMQFTKESAMYACGYRYWITKEIAEKFRYSLKSGQSLKVTNLENFGRVIPKNVIAKLKSCNEKRLFDSYVIFHLDARGKNSVVETEKQKKERERDPILFGRITECEDRYYFIADWIDELDDLQFSDILDALSLDKKDIQIEKSVSMEDVKKAILSDSQLRKKLK